VLAFGFISGCGNEEVLMRTEMAVAPGYIRLDSGPQIQVFGYDQCPGGDVSLIGKPSASNMENHCTLIRKNDPRFEISVGTANGMVVEFWTVAADRNTIKLVRPDGDGATVFRLAKK